MTNFDRLADFDVTCGMNDLQYQLGEYAESQMLVRGVAAPSKQWAVPRKVKRFRRLKTIVFTVLISMVAMFVGIIILGSIVGPQS